MLEKPAALQFSDRELYGNIAKQVNAGMPTLHATAYLKSPAAHPPSGMVALFGAERYLRQQAFDALKSVVLGDTGDDDVSLTRFPGRDADLEWKAVADELRTVSMFGDVRLVVVEDADEFVTRCRAQLEAYLKSPAKKSLLVLLVKTWQKTTKLAKQVAKDGLSIDCGKLEGADLLNWIAETGRSEFGKQISRDVGRLVVEMAGTELGLLSQEIAKVAAYAGEREKVVPDDVRAVVGGWTTQTAFKMIDALIDGRLNVALKLLDELLRADESPYRIMGAITASFRKLAVATDAAAHGTDLKAALSSAGIFNNRIRSAETYLRNVGYREAAEIYNRLLETDGQLKGEARISERLAVERLLVKLSGRVRTRKTAS